MISKLPFLPDAHHYAIAAVATRGAQLDHAIESAIHSAFLDSPNTAAFVLKNLGADRVVGLFQAVYVDALPRLTDQIDALIAAINDARTDRNETMHWIWGKSDNPETAVTATMRPYREHRRKAKTAPQIEAVANRLMECVHAVSWYQLTLLKERYPSSPSIAGLPTHPPSLPLPSGPHLKRQRTKRDRSPPQQQA